MCKKIFAILTLTLFAITGLKANEYCEAPMVPVNNNSIFNKFTYNSCGIHNFNYVKVGGGIVRAHHFYSITPTISLGHRFDKGNSAIDLSINWAGNDKKTFYATPRVVVLKYLDHNSLSSMYYGVGLSYGGITGHHTRRFNGIFAEGVVGWETYLEDVKAFAEINVSQAAVPFKDHYSIDAPVITFAVGVGF